MGCSSSCKKSILVCQGGISRSAINYVEPITKYSRMKCFFIDLFELHLDRYSIVITVNFLAIEKTSTSIHLENLVLNSTGFFHQDTHSSMSKAAREVPPFSIGRRFSSLMSVDQLGALRQ